MKTKTNLKAGVSRSDLHANCRGIMNPKECRDCCARVHPTWLAEDCKEACHPGKK